MRQRPRGGDPGQLDILSTCLPVRVAAAINLHNVINTKIHSSCEIEYFVEPHLCELCVILRSRVFRVVCPQ